MVQEGCPFLPDCAAPASTSWSARNMRLSPTAA